jgi:hypothetical protein
MRKLLAIFCLVSACSLTLAATGPAVTKACADTKGWVHIITADGHDHTIEPKKWQVGGGFEAVEVARDGRTVDWWSARCFAPVKS